jgi:hypothetical protein
MASDTYYCLLNVMDAAQDARRNEPPRYVGSMSWGFGVPDEVKNLVAAKLAHVDVCPVEGPLDVRYVARDLAKNVVFART